MLTVENLQVSYGSIRALHGISLSVPQGSIVTLIGANGAGKSTTLRALSGLVKASAGTVTYDGKDITRLAPNKIVAEGLCHVPEGRMVFANLTVRENLKMGAYLQRDRKWIADQTDYVFGLFPRLKERENQSAGTLSGGEQQMLAIGRALLSKPKFLMLDEPSLGIAPLLVKTIFERIVEINREQGLTVLLVEQNANLALDVSTYGYVLESGKILIEGPSKDLKANPEVQAAYLGC
ncbi:MAG: ABC transporter ATP-binding protein [Verrucomicrobiales bacterium VVV1]|nr:MAG: ABC transporter ATP-binding protein [Verrucomicrobiales bacterium VVV1]